MKTFIYSFILIAWFALSVLMAGGGEQQKTLGSGKTVVVKPTETVVEYPVPSGCDMMSVETVSGYVIASASKYHIPVADIDSPTKITCKRRP